MSTGAAYRGVELANRSDASAPQAPQSSKDVRRRAQMMLKLCALLVLSSLVASPYSCNSCCRSSRPTCADA